MKNKILKSFVIGLLVLSVICFSYILSFFYVVSDFMWAIFKFDLMCIILGLISVGLFVWFVVYFFRHRDKHLVIPTVEFEKPEGMTPVEVGYLVDGIIDDSDLSALLVYWASEKYIEISKDKGSQKIKRLVEKLPDNSKNYEKALFSKIFGKDKTIAADNISQRLQNDNTVTNVVNEVEKGVGSLYFDSKAIRNRQLFICAFMFLFWFCAMYFRLEYYYDIIPIVEIFVVGATALYVICAEWVIRYYDYRHKNNTYKLRIVSFVVFTLLTLVIGGLCIYFYMTDWYQAVFLCVLLVMMYLVVLGSMKIQIYTKAGSEKLGKLLGLKNFIQVTEADRIKMLVEENPAMFYDVLPYAYVLGVSDKWIENLEVIKQIDPEIVNRDLSNVLIYHALFSNRNLHLIRAVRTARTLRAISTVGKVAGSISLGRNGGSGGSKGGSNFGGIRRR